MHTFHTLDLSSSKASECSLVLGTGDTSGADSALNINNRSSHRRPTLSGGKTALSRHFRTVGASVS